MQIRTASGPDGSIYRLIPCKPNSSKALNVSNPFEAYLPAWCLRVNRAEVWAKLVKPLQPAHLARHACTLILSTNEITLATAWRQLCLYRLLDQEKLVKWTGLHAYQSECMWVVHQAAILGSIYFVHSLNYSFHSKWGVARQVSKRMKWGATVSMQAPLLCYSPLKLHQLCIAPHCLLHASLRESVFS